ncbi:MAG TPA: HU family DNA-binding protein [Spirochaetota bacterium]|nr:HU family DNA-binding protein [Spirochaetota bacterium]HPJ39218.1 HU family DNA-binding protein [Spirochaetota bacterium]HPQ53381.1 HU family DNA-binding protein [Spirochaetota bacterium]
MTKQEIVLKIAEQSGIKRREVSYIIDNFLDYIVKSADNGEKVEIRGFGSFSRVIRKKRNVYSPIAGKHLHLPEKSILTFKASKNTEQEIEGA